MKIPAGHQTVMPYLIVEGPEKFLDFLKDIFNAVEKLQVPDPEGGIMHAEVIIGNSTIMFAAATAQYKPAPANLFVYVEDVDKTYQQALESGATSVRKPRQEDYGYSGGVLDPFGNTWWITGSEL
jgi:PhnB protein